METTTDKLLGGRIQLRQPAEGYRVAVDPVLLAAAVRADKYQRVAELGCGTGAALLCLNARVMGLSGIGLEPDATLRNLAEANMDANAAPFGIIEGDVETALTFDPQEYDHVFFNPPFYDDADFSASPHETRNKAHALTVPLAGWFKAARRMLKPEGELTLIIPPAMLQETLGLMNGMGAIEVLPIRAASAKPAKRLIVRGIMGRKTPLAVLPDFILHKEDGSYTDGAEAVLRGGKALP
ncbi:MAG: tRNA1(Val) (adenine(37)-N6)-methyltransferase [Bdellovibrionales bacterium]